MLCIVLSEDVLLWSKKKKAFCWKFSVCPSRRFCIISGNIGKERCEQVVTMAEIFGHIARSKVHNRTGSQFTCCSNWVK